MALSPGDKTDAMEVWSNEEFPLLNLVILEQFLVVLPPEMGIWVRDSRLESTSQAVSPVQGFLLNQAVNDKQEQQLVRIMDNVRG